MIGCGCALGHDISGKANFAEKHQVVMIEAVDKMEKSRWREDTVDINVDCMD